MRFAAFRRLGFRKIPVGLTPFVVFCSTTVFCVLEMLRISLIAHKKPSHTAKTLYAIVPKHFFIIVKNI
jgi:hypothetical protein